MKDGIYLNDIPIDLFIDYFSKENNEQLINHQNVIRNIIDFNLEQNKEYPYILYNGADLILEKADNDSINLSTLPNYKAYICSDSNIKIYQDVPIDSNLVSLSLYKKVLYYNNLINCNEIDIYTGVPIKITIGASVETRNFYVLAESIVIELVNFSSIYELINKNISININNTNIINSKIKKTGRLIAIENFEEIVFDISSGKIKMIIPITIKDISRNSTMICYLNEKIIEQRQEKYRYRQFSEYYNTIVTTISYVTVESKFYSAKPLKITVKEKDIDGNDISIEKEFYYLNDIKQYFQNKNKYFETLSSKLRGKLVPDNVIYNEKKEALCDCLDDILNEKQSSKYDQLLSKNNFYKVNSFCNAISEFIKMDETTNEQIQLSNRSLISIDDIDYTITAEFNDKNIEFSFESDTKETILTNTKDKRDLITRIKEYKQFPLSINYLKNKEEKDNQKDYIINKDEIGEPLIFVDTKIKTVEKNYNLYETIFKNIKEKAIDTFVFYIKNIELMKPDDYYKFQNKESEFLNKLENIKDNLKELNDKEATEKTVINNLDDTIEKLFSNWRAL